MSNLYKMQANFTRFTGQEWLLINLASHYGLDKEVYDVRLAFGREVLEELKRATTFDEYALILNPWTIKADVPEEFAACAIAIWDTLQGDSSNYAVGLDVCNSGAQIMSCLGRCLIGMKNTGLINTGERPDLYIKILANVQGFQTSRPEVKQATVPHLYGSKLEPKNVFGEERYDDFISACRKTMPVVEWAKDVLISSWNSNALFHEIILPNGGVCHMKVIDKTQYVGKFQGFNYNFYVEENKAKPFGEIGTTSLAANTIHPFDSYVLSELDARCNYSTDKLQTCLAIIDSHIAIGSSGVVDELVILNQLTNKFNICSIVAVEHLAFDKLNGLDNVYLNRVRELVESVLELKHFELKCIHDEYGCLPNHVNTMKLHYNVIMAEAYQSTWLIDTIELLSGVSYHQYLPAIDPVIVQAILDNNYAIC